eukprot:7391108-Prymnesium_polylepis.2
MRVDARRERRRDHAVQADGTCRRHWRVAPLVHVMSCARVVCGRRWLRARLSGARWTTCVAPRVCDGLETGVSHSMQPSSLISGSRLSVSHLCNGPLAAASCSSFGSATSSISPHASDSAAASRAFSASARVRASASCARAGWSADIRSRRSRLWTRAHRTPSERERSSCSAFSRTGVAIAVIAAASSADGSSITFSEVSGGSAISTPTLSAASLFLRTVWRSISPLSIRSSGCSSVLIASSSGRLTACARDGSAEKTARSRTKLSNGLSRFSNVREWSYGAQRSALKMPTRPWIFVEHGVPLSAHRSGAAMARMARLILLSPAPS